MTALAASAGGSCRTHPRGPRCRVANLSGDPEQMRLRGGADAEPGGGVNHSLLRALRCKPRSVSVASSRPPLPTAAHHAQHTGSAHSFPTGESRGAARGASTAAGDAMSGSAVPPSLAPPPDPGRVLRSAPDVQPPILVPRPHSMDAASPSPCPLQPGLRAAPSGLKRRSRYPTWALGLPAGPSGRSGSVCMPAQKETDLLSVTRSAPRLHAPYHRSAG